MSTCLAHSCMMRVSYRIRFRYHMARYDDVPRIQVPIRPVSYHPDTRIASDTRYALPAKFVYKGLIQIKNQSLILGFFPRNIRYNEFFCFASFHQKKGSIIFYNFL